MRERGSSSNIHTSPSAVFTLNYCGLKNWMYLTCH